MVPILRLRLELDRTLRERAFFGRALRGQLEPREYLEMIAQYGRLAVAFPGPRALQLGRSLAHDMALVGRLVDRDAPAVVDCPPLLLVAGYLPPPSDWLPREVAGAIGITVLGTSCIGRAGTALGARFPGAASFLGELAAGASPSMAALEDRLGGRGEGHKQRVYALAELTRGASLALATYLDTRWRAPVLNGDATFRELN